MGSKDIHNRFVYRAPTTPEKRENHEMVRRAVWGCAALIDNNTPEGREKSLAITKLEEALFWANAAIARNETSP